jgi:hypothetical protein
MKKVVIYWFGFLFILLWMTSCATRKVQKSTEQKASAIETNSTQKKDLKIEGSKNVKVETEVIANGETTIEKTTYTPVNPNLPSTFLDDKGQKKELNNTSYSNEKITSKNTKNHVTKSTDATNATVVDNSSFADKAKFKTKDKTQYKQTNRTSFSWWFLLLLIVPVAFYAYWNIKNTNY